MANMKSTQVPVCPPVLRLVPRPRVASPPCVETVSCIEALLEHAKDGFVVGLAFVVLFKGRRFLVEATGGLKKDPTFARGAIAALDDEMRELMQEMASERADEIELI